MMKTVFIETLGCSRNEVDSRVVTDNLQAAGYQVTGDARESDIIIINTCSFIESSRQEAIETIIEYCQLKKNDPKKKIVVIGCLPQYYRDKLREQIPEIDQVAGTGDLDRIVAVITGASQPDYTSRGHIQKRPLRGTSRPTGAYQYIKISEGCSRHCAFCKIPDLKGEYRSRDRHSIIDEVKHMLDEGIRELILIGQETTNYGRDRRDTYRFQELLDDLDRSAGDFRIRFLYAYWQDITPELIEQIKQSKKIHPYFDMPFQHSHPTVLRKMRRPGSSGEFLALIENIRNGLPRSYIRSSFIVGHPYESAREFRGLLEFLTRAQLDRAVFFPYSREPGTVSANYRNRPGRAGCHPSDRVISRRYERARNHQVAIERSREQILYKTNLEVLVEENRSGNYYGRSYRDAPEIEGRVRITGPVADDDLGAFITVTILDGDGIELTGRKTRKTV